MYDDFMYSQDITVEQFCQAELKRSSWAIRSWKTKYGKTTINKMFWERETY